MKQDPKRITTWWIRWEDLNWPSPDNEDKIRRTADAIAASNANAAMIFGAHFRWDFLPYFTILHDYIAKITEELHSRGVALFDHHSVSLVHRYDTPEQMRHVMLHSGPHLPISPSREAAACWEYGGRKLNDWRMIDVRSGEPLYFPQYAAEGFCPNNPEFVGAYLDYAGQLIRDTGLDGISADDPVHYMHYASCGCVHCRAKFRERTGLELPPVEDASFWGNWDNPAWKAWCDLRLDGTDAFFKQLADAVPEGFELMTCGNDSASPKAVAMASDGRRFLSGCTRLNLEIQGNTPPYKHDPLTHNQPIINRFVTSSLHQAQARQTGARCFGTGFAFTESTANVVWALNKTNGADCWLITLKPRLGLPQHVLDTLPDESDIIGTAYTYEKEHPKLFAGTQVAQTAVYFSYEMRDHTLFGSLYKGYYADYRQTLQSLLHAGISVVTVTDLPEDTKQFGALVVPSAAVLSAEEEAALERYLACGGKVIVTGPSALDGCSSSLVLPNAANAPATEFFRTSNDGIHLIDPPWQHRELAPCTENSKFTEVRNGLHFCPHRASEDGVMEQAVALLNSFSLKAPVTLLRADGYFATTFRNGNSCTMHFLAEDFDTKIDKKLDDMRFHRSRVNYITEVKPLGVTRTLRFRAPVKPEVYLPFHTQQPEAVLQDGVYSVALPEDCYYVVLHFPAMFET